MTNPLPAFKEAEQLARKLRRLQARKAARLQEVADDYDAKMVELKEGASAAALGLLESALLALRDTEAPES